MRHDSFISWGQGLILNSCLAGQEVPQDIYGESSLICSSLPKVGHFMGLRSPVHFQSHSFLCSALWDNVN